MSEIKSGLVEPIGKELQAVIDRTKIAMASAFIGSCKVKATRRA